MIEETPLAFARRMRLSSGAIFAAIILTGAAFLAVAAAIRPAYESNHTRVIIEGPVSSLITPISVDHTEALPVLPSAPTQN